MPREIEVTSVLNKTKKRDSWFLDDYTLNLYSSCSFNCLYCYIRGSKYGMNLQDSLSVKINALEILEKQLHMRAKKEQYGIIVLSSATDPYLQIEDKYRLSRSALELILKYKFPVHIITKSDLVERDFDLLKEIDQSAIIPKDLQLKRGTILSFSFSSLEDTVSKIFEPGATPPSKRLQTVASALNQKLLTGISFMPLLPFISDTTEQLEYAFTTFKKLNINYILPASLTLFGTTRVDSKTLVLNAIKKHYPHLEKKYLSYFKNSYEMPLFYRKAFDKKMKELCQQYNLNRHIPES